MQIEESEIIFLGLSADHIIKVTVFASGLRDDPIELTLNDLSMEFMDDFTTKKLI